MSTSPVAAVACDIKDLALADGGKRRIDSAFQSMPVLQAVRKQFIKNQPLAGLRIGVRLPVTAESACLLVALRDSGGQVALCASNPNVQDDVAASLVRDYAISVFAVSGEDLERQQARMTSVQELRPHILIDDGASLASQLSCDPQPDDDAPLGATEESLAGAAQLANAARRQRLAIPVVNVAQAATRSLFLHRYSAAQSTLEALSRSANLLVSGLNFVIAGYGLTGRAIATRARALGATVIITEVDPLKALEAAMDGCRVTSMSEAAALGDIFCTATGNKTVLAREQFEKMKNGAVICNASDLQIEIDLEALGRIASSRRMIRESLEEFTMRDGRRLFVLAGGKPAVSSLPGGHPAAVLDVSYATHALSAEYLARNRGSLEKKVYAVPAEIDHTIAKLKLEAMNVKIDRLTVEQEQYLAGLAGNLQ